jgi:3-hydroxyisobutyrate dehydrogenase-like beta-hydroxyacid dehydrogenase
MSDNTGMNDHEDTHSESDAGELVEQLSTAEPQDAPEIAERLADRLARELDATDGRGVAEQGTPS